MKLMWKDINITEYVTSVAWAGSAKQAARSVTFSVAYSPNDKDVKDLGIKLDSDGFKLNPLKRMEEGMIGGKKIMGTARGLAAGAAIGIGATELGYWIGDKITGERSRWHVGTDGTALTVMVEL